MRSSFPKIGTPTPEAELEALRKRAWIEQGVLSIDPKKVADWKDRQLLINIGNGQYGVGVLGKSVDTGELVDG